MARDPQITPQTMKVLLSLLDGGNTPLSGAEMAKLTGLASGSLYPILLRLEKAGWLDSQWEASDPCELGRPRRRFYTMTALGQAKLRAHAMPIVISIQGAAWA
jgi:PadR family transcriptional regulator, regulatory protein PadR